MGALGALAWGTGDCGTTYGALHQLYLNIFRTHKLYFRIIKRKFWDTFVIQIEALVLILPKLEALT